MHFCRICRTEKNLKYTVKELRKFSRKRCNDRLLCTTPTLGNICHDCEERLHNFHRLDVNEDNDDRVIVDDDELLYNLFFEKVEQHRLMKRLMVVGGGAGGGEWNTTTLRQQTLVAATAGVALNVPEEIIEVLTSRENTPSPALPISSTPGGIHLSAEKLNTIKTPIKENVPTEVGSSMPNINITATNITTSTQTTASSNNVVSPIVNNCSPYKVVAVIDLDDDEDDVPTDKVSSVLKPQKTLETDEEEIVFRKVDPDQDQILKKNKRGKRSSRKGKYQNRQLNLIASLSLVSSDSESDIEHTEKQCSPLKQNTKTLPVQNDNEGANTNLPSPTIKINNNIIDAISSPPYAAHVQQEESLDAGVKCPVCQIEFPASQRLIQHMRRKHRSYDGEVLSERPRCAQDSAMTIRLRYMQRYIYYECQLCGCIDAAFKVHKEHVMQNHAEESKSLKDPMMQNLKCPLCKEKCGAQHADLLRHMLHSHKFDECGDYFHQITHIRNLFSNCGLKKEKELERTARIYQIAKRKQYFFECIQCEKIITGYFNYLKHQSTHVKPAPDHNSTDCVPETESLPSTLPSTETEPVKAKQNCVEMKVKFEKPKPVLTPKKLRSKDKISAQTLIQKDGQRRGRKLTKKAVQAALVKVKVKPPLKQLPTQRYKCKICLQKFKGFHRLNLHILRDHASDDGRLRCKVCVLRFGDKNKLEEHQQKRHLCKQKRKYVVNCELKRVEQDFSHETEVVPSTVDRKRRRRNSQSNDFESETQVSKLAKKDSLVDDKHEATKAIWLHELFTLATKSPIVNSSDKTTPDCINRLDCKGMLDITKESALSSPLRILTSHQCLYCAHLFNSIAELESHEEVHAQRQEVKMLKRCQIRNVLPKPIPL
uniref:C2H2-type domain-containing protein n=1 Tax=Ceratitis capitata TaxID=7213 RepID=W8C0X2_CERCA